MEIFWPAGLDNQTSHTVLQSHSHCCLSSGISSRVSFPQDSQQMTSSHSLVSKKTEEPRWVTQCLEGFKQVDKSKEKVKKEEHSLSKFLSNLIPRRERDHSKPPKKPPRKERKLLSEEREMTRAADEIYKEILQTVQLQSPLPRKGIIKGRWAVVRVHL